MKRLQQFLQHRSKEHLNHIEAEVFGPDILEVGAAEGWVGKEIKSRHPSFRIQLLDVIDLNQTELPLKLYDGKAIPFADNSFDTVIVMMVLHHCEDPEAVLQEAARVSKKRLVVTESVYRFWAGHYLLWFMDNLVNSLRSGGWMAKGLHFRTVPEWEETFERYGLRLLRKKWISKGLHRHIAFVLDGAQSRSKREVMR